MRIGIIKKLAGVALLSLLPLTACSAPNAETAPVGPRTNTAGSAPSIDSLNKLIDSVRNDVKSDFQKKILDKAKQTGEITESDWKEANNKFVTCMAELGASVQLQFDGARVQYLRDAETGTKRDDEAAKQKRADQHLECYSKTSMGINEVYQYLNESSASTDGDEIQRAVLKCLIERKLVPESTTYDEFLADLQKDGPREFSPSGQENEEEIAKCWIENT